MSRKCDVWHLQSKMHRLFLSNQNFPRFQLFSQRNEPHQHQLSALAVLNQAAAHPEPASPTSGATASAGAVTQPSAAVELVALWKETSLAIKQLDSPDRRSASAAARAFPPSTPPPSLQLLLWGAAALWTDSTRDPLEKVLDFQALIIKFKIIVVTTSGSRSRRPSLNIFCRLSLADAEAVVQRGRTRENKAAGFGQLSLSEQKSRFALFLCVSILDSSCSAVAR